MQEHFGITAAADADFKPNYNITPSMQVPVVRRQDAETGMAFCHWGLVPHWSKADQKLKPINARAETIESKPFFREAFRSRRCLIPCSGYYEWKTFNGAKQPYLIRVSGTGLFAFAGVWDQWQGADNLVESCAIITTTATDELRQVHDRMPVIVPPDLYGDWLQTGGKGYLVPYNGEMEFYPVSKAVNNPRNNSPDLLKRAG